MLSRSPPDKASPTPRDRRMAATAAAAQYLTWGLLVRPGSLPGAGLVARSYPAVGFTALTLIGFVLLLTPTGKLPSPAR